MDRKFISTAFGYAIVGLVLGIYMAATKNHGQLVTHAHIMLVGFVVSFVYGVCYRFWPAAESARMPVIQFWAHQVGTAVLVVALFLLYGQFANPQVLGPVLGAASLLVLIAMVLMKVVYLRSSKREAPGANAVPSV